MAEMQSWVVIIHLYISQISPTIHPGSCILTNIQPNGSCPTFVTSSDDRLNQKLQIQRSLRQHALRYTIELFVGNHNFYAFNYLFKEITSAQRWLTAAKPYGLVKKFEEHNRNIFAKRYEKKDEKKFEGEDVEFREGGQRSHSPEKSADNSTGVRGHSKGSDSKGVLEYVLWWIFRGSQFIRGDNLPFPSETAHIAVDLSYPFAPHFFKPAGGDSDSDGDEDGGVLSGLNNATLLNLSESISRGEFNIGERLI
ncbi:hypothetical protein F4680DRAFT_451825 [Xylaria scruposa]|nr:hypothetical protein F4680DRAFT_451825 [Xylaria scruposa]